VALRLAEAFARQGGIHGILDVRGGGGSEEPGRQRSGMVQVVHIAFLRLWAAAHR